MINETPISKCFCGSSAILTTKHKYFQQTDKTDRSWICECISCSNKGTPDLEQTGAVLNWNREQLMKTILKQRQGQGQGQG